MSHNRDLSAAAAQLGFHSSNIGIGSEAPRYPLDIHGGNLLVSGSAAGNLILEDRGVGDSSRPFHVVSSDGGKFVINRSNRNASGTTTSSVTSLTLSNGGNLGLGGQTSPASNIHIGDISNGYELKISANALQFNRSSSSYIDQLHDTGRILFRTGSSYTETMRIESNGNVGVNATNPERKLEVVDTNSNGSYPLAVSNFINSTANKGAAIDFRLTTGGNTRGELGCKWTSNSSSDGTYFYIAPNDGTTGNIERLRIDNAGTLLVNSTIDNTGGHGQIVAHAPTTGNTIYKAIEIGNTDGNGTARGAAICGQPKSNSHLPYTLIGSWDHGDNTDVYYGGGWGGAMRPATRHRFYTNSSYPTSGASGTQTMTLDSNGHLTLPNQPVFNAIGFPSHRYMNVWHNVDLDDWNYVDQNGSYFDNSTGRFTAPVAGKYFFIFTSMYTNPSTGDFHNWIYKNGVGIVLSNNHSGGGGSNGHQWNDCTIQAVITLAANDYVTARCTGSSNSQLYLYGSGASSIYSCFSGFLIG